MFKQFLKDEEGQTTVEYMLIIAVIVAAIALFGKTLSRRLPETLDKVFNGIQKKIDQLMNASLGQ